MSTFCAVAMVLVIIIGIPVMIIWTIINLIRKKSPKVPLCGIGSCIFVALILAIIFGNTYEPTPEQKKLQEQQQIAQQQKKKADEKAKAEKETEKQKEKEIKALEKAEKEAEKQRQKEIKELEKAEKQAIKQQEKQIADKQNELAAKEKELQQKEAELNKQQEQYTETERTKTIEDTVNDIIDPIQKGNTKLSFKYMDMTVDFLEHKIETNYIDEQCLVLYFQFTNNSKDNQAFCYNYFISAFQNGVELDNSYFHTDSEASRNYEREIQPGTSVTVSCNYKIQNTSAPVQVEITPFSMWTDRKLLEFTVNPS